MNHSDFWLRCVNWTINYAFMIYRVFSGFFSQLSKVEQVAVWLLKVEFQPCYLLKHFSALFKPPKQKKKILLQRSGKTLAWVFQAEKLGKFLYTLCVRFIYREIQWKTANKWIWNSLINIYEPATPRLFHVLLLSFPQKIIQCRHFDLKFYPKKKSLRDVPRTHHSRIIVVIIATVVEVVDRCQGGVVFHCVRVHKCIVYQWII